MTVAFVKLADSQIYMADHYTKSTRFHDADNDKVVCRICMDAVRVSGTVDTKPCRYHYKPYSSSAPAIPRVY